MLVHTKYVTTETAFFYGFGDSNSPEDGQVNMEKYLLFLNEKAVLPPQTVTTI